MELIKTYFLELSEKQLTQYEALYDLYTDWNSKSLLLYTTSTSTGMRKSTLSPAKTSKICTSIMCSIHWG